MSNDEDQLTTDHTWCHRKLEILQCLFHWLVNLLHRECGGCCICQDFTKLVFPGFVFKFTSSFG